MEDHSQDYKKKQKVFLPPPRYPHIKKTLILDIDETLIHCSDERDPEDAQPDVIIRIPLDEEDEDDYADAGINIRPHIEKMLR